MDGVQSITHGWWRPTPGSIYPLLKEMTDQGLVKKLDDGRYELTEKGRSEAGGSFGPAPARGQTMDELVEQLSSSVSYMEDLQRSGRGNVTEQADRLREIRSRISALMEEDREG